MKHFGWIAGSWATALLLGLPVLALVFSAFSADGELFAHLADTVLPDYLRNTSGLVLGVVCLSLLFGVPTAWLVAMCEVPGRRALQWALMLPMAMPSYIVAYVYTDLLDYSGPLQAGLRALFGWQGPADYWFPAIRSLGGAAWVLALVLFPYVYLLARASFLEQSVSLIHSSRLLGCTPWQSFRRLSLPLARPAIMVGASLVAMETLADFATVHFFAINTLTTAIYDTWLGYGSLATAAKLSCLMLLAVVLLIALERRSRQRQQVFQKSMGFEQPLRYPLGGLRGVLAGLWCWGLVLAGFALPFVILFDYGVRYFALSWTPEFVRFAGNSLAISALTALLAMASRHSQVSQIARVLRIMEQRFTENLTVEELAREANMSVSAFHHHFKAATATSPLQYIKTLRLHRARLMMLHDGLKAGVAADKVGYESGSQVSREYKRFFGNTPSEHAARFRSGQLRIVEG